MRTEKKKEAIEAVIIGKGRIVRRSLATRDQGEEGGDTDPEKKGKEPEEKEEGGMELILYMLREAKEKREVIKKGMQEAKGEKELLREEMKENFKKVKKEIRVELWAKMKKELDRLEQERRDGGLAKQIGKGKEGGKIERQDKQERRRDGARKREEKFGIDRRRVRQGKKKEQHYIQRVRGKKKLGQGKCGGMAEEEFRCGGETVENMGNRGYKYDWRKIYRGQGKDHELKS